ncbi:MAG: hypothetical protein ABEK36_06215 [Candidatus Aenigmatarchaeota archaeon]
MKELQSEEIFGLSKDQKKLVKKQKKKRKKSQEIDWDRIINLFSIQSNKNLRDYRNIMLILQNLKESSEKTREIYEHSLVKEIIKET